MNKAVGNVADNLSATSYAADAALPNPAFCAAISRVFWPLHSGELTTLRCKPELVSPPRRSPCALSSASTARNNEGPLQKASLRCGSASLPPHSPVLEASYECGLLPPGVTSDLSEDSAGSGQTEQSLPPSPQHGDADAVNYRPARPRPAAARPLIIFAC